MKRDEDELLPIMSESKKKRKKIDISSQTSFFLLRLSSFVCDSVLQSDKPKKNWGNRGRRNRDLREKRKTIEKFKN